MALSANKLMHVLRDCMDCSLQQAVFLDSNRCTVETEVAVCLQRLLVPSLVGVGSRAIRSGGGVGV
jgi:hypothetical protein